MGNHCTPHAPELGERRQVNLGLSYNQSPNFLAENVICHFVVEVLGAFFSCFKLTEHGIYLSKGLRHRGARAAHLNCVSECVTRLMTQQREDDATLIPSSPMRRLLSSSEPANSPLAHAAVYRVISSSVMTTIINTERHGWSYLR